MRHTFTSNNYMQAGIFVVLALIAGCASRQEAKPEQIVDIVAGPRVSAVSRVTITLDPALEADRVERYREEDGERVLREAIEEELSKAGRLGGVGAPTMNVRVTGFRLRSTAAAFWVGVMAGVDLIEVTASIRADGKDIKAYSTADSTFLGGLVMPGAGTRLRRICAGVAERVVSHL